MCIYSAINHSVCWTCTQWKSASLRFVVVEGVVDLHNRIRVIEEEKV